MRQDSCLDRETGARRRWLIGAYALGIGVAVCTFLLLHAVATTNQPMDAREKDCTPGPVFADGEPSATSGSAWPWRSPPGSRAVSAGSADAPSERWRTVFSETFESGIGSRWVTDAVTADTGAHVWTTSTFTSANGDWSAWCAGGGDAPGDSYTDSMDVWLVSDPIEIDGSNGGLRGAEVRFAWWLDTAVAAAREAQALGLEPLHRVDEAPVSGDWFAWGIITDVNDLQSGQWTYVSDAATGWQRTSLQLDALLPLTESVTTTLRIGFRFVSDDDGAVGRGAFVDDVELRVQSGYQMALPLVVKDLDTVPMPKIEDLVVNGGFEADWGEESSHRVKVFPVDGEPYLTELGEFHTPPGWLAWFRHDPGTWDQPEVGDIRKEHVPYRVHGGEKAARLFTFYRSHDAGFMQQIPVQPGAPLTLTAYAHAWSNHPLDGYDDCTDDPRCSSGVGTGGHFLLPEDIPPLNGDPWNDAVGNFAFQVGIDPSGGTDPLADRVMWGTKAYVYNEYHKLPTVSVEAEGETATIFLRSTTLWGFKHNDAYWDDVELLGVRGAPNPNPDPPPEPIGWVYPVITEGSKIGVHAIRSNNVQAFAQDLIDAGARFPVVKAVDDFGWLEEVARVSPDTIFVGRRTWGFGEGCWGVESWDDGDMRDHAEEAIDRILTKIDEDPDLELIVDYWEPYNEPDPPGVAGYRKLAELMIVTMDVAEEHDLKLALFSLNAGTPEWDEMEAMVDTGVFARARRGGHILSLHEGTFESHDPRQYWGGSIPGAPEVDGAGALNFRYRYLYYLLKQRGEVVPLVVSEWYCGDEQTASTETLVDALRWYDGEASKDYYFWATCPFTLGPSPGWGHTDYERVYEGGLIDHMIKIRGRQNGVEPGELQADGLHPALRSEGRRES